jgi:hypothetical protein
MGESLGNIHVFCRIRPLLSGEVKRGEREGFVSVQDPQTIVALQSISGTPAVSGVTRKAKFSFNGVFGPDASQLEVFDRTARNVVEGTPPNPPLPLQRFHGRFWRRDHAGIQWHRVCVRPERVREDLHYAVRVAGELLVVGGC